MTVQELQAAAEAILFASGEPLETPRIAEALELDLEYTEALLDKLAAELDERGSGLCVLKLDDRYQLCSRTQFADIIRSVLEVKKNSPLSSAALEVLAIVAYNQPITRSYIEQVRGVDCSGVISTLCQRELIEEMGRLDLPGRPLLYGTTPEFLKCFCLSSLSELPELPDKGAKGERPGTDDAGDGTAEGEAEFELNAEYDGVPEDGDEMFNVDAE
jgi:segregation and condensation protein B